MSTPAAPLLDDRFLLLEEIGHGGTATVYRAFDRSERKLVAVKVPEDRSGGETERAWIDEFSAWRRLRHPNIIRALELRRTRRGPLPEGIPYLVLENFAGAPAHRALVPGDIDPSTLETFASHVLAALDHVHEAGLVHRDLKPGNLLVEESARGALRVKLTDFGLATESGHAGEPGMVSGSLPYIAPESLLGLQMDGRADLYSLGIVISFLASGRMPADTRDLKSLLRWHLAGPPWEGTEDASRLPARLRRFVGRLLERDRDLRPASAREALDLLQSNSEPRPRSRPLMRIARTAELATLRLALDAIRAGELRTFLLPPDPAASDALVEEAHTRSQLQGIGFYRLDAACGQGGWDLARLVLAIAEDRGSEGLALLKRHRVDRVLPISFLEGIPLLDRSHPRVEPGAAGLLARLRARVAAAFLRDAARTAPLVLLVARRVLADDATRGAIARLVKSSPARGSSSSARAGGLLILLGAGVLSRGSAHATPDTARVEGISGAIGLPVTLV